MLDAMRSADLTVLRTWAFCEFHPAFRPALTFLMALSSSAAIHVCFPYQCFTDSIHHAMPGDGPEWNALQPEAGVFEERVFAALDWVVAEAGARGIRLSLPLVNYWPAYGGIPQYVRSVPVPHLHLKCMLGYNQTWTGIWYTPWQAGVIWVMLQMELSASRGGGFRQPRGLLWGPLLPGHIPELPGHHHLESEHHHKYCLQVS